MRGRRKFPRKHGMKLRLLVGGRWANSQNLHGRFSFNDLSTVTTIGFFIGGLIYTPPKDEQLEREVMMLWFRCCSELPGGRKYSRVKQPFIFLGSQPTIPECLPFSPRSWLTSKVMVGWFRFFIGDGCEFNSCINPPRNLLTKHLEEESRFLDILNSKHGIR